MQAGKWGIVVVMLAIVGTLVVSWTISMDVNEVEVTKYNPLADMTGEFAVEKTPDYVEYNPSTNYTGYYTDSSIVGSTKYFDGVSFTESPSGNNFRVKANPTVELDSSVTLSDYSGQYPFNTADHSVSLVYSSSESSVGIKNSIFTTSSTIVSLSSYIAAMNLPDAKSFTITSNQGLPSVYDRSSVTDLNCIIFSQKDMWVDSSSRMSINFITPARLAEENVQNGYAGPSGVHFVLPWLSAVINMDSLQVTVYYDADCSDDKMAGTYPLSDIVMVYGGSETLQGRVNFDSSADFEAVGYTLAYMDPSKGVELE